MLALTSTAATSSSGMFSAAKWVSFWGFPSSSTSKSDCFNPRTNRPSSSVTTALIWTTSTSTDSANCTFFVRTVWTMRLPFLSVATARTWCAAIRSPEFQSHSNGGVDTVHTCAPSAKNVNCVTSRLAETGSMTATSLTGPDT